MNSVIAIRSRTLIVTMGVLLLFVSAQIQIPIQPVPVTLQTMAVMFFGLCFEQRTALYAVLTYLILGLFGVPVLAQFSGGLHVFTGASAGYMIGFLPAVWVMTSLRERMGNPNWLASFGLVTLGTLVIISCGVTWLSTFVGFKEAILLGVVPFIIPGVIKAMMLTAVVRFFKHA